MVNSAQAWQRQVVHTAVCMTKRGIVSPCGTDDTYVSLHVVSEENAQLVCDVISTM